MGLRTGSIQEGSQPGPRLDRKARARKDPKAHGGFKRNQACSARGTCGELRRGVRGPSLRLIKYFMRLESS
eukprot:scaffold30758_cov50-Phaeocystis_antarctica.AAC.1